MRRGSLSKGTDRQAPDEVLGVYVRWISLLIRIEACLGDFWGTGEKATEGTRRVISRPLLHSLVMRHHHVQSFSLLLFTTFWTQFLSPAQTLSSPTAVLFSFFNFLFVPPKTWPNWHWHDTAQFYTLKTKQTNDAAEAKNTKRRKSTLEKRSEISMTPSTPPFHSTSPTITHFWLTQTVRHTLRQAGRPETRPHDFLLSRLLLVLLSSTCCSLHLFSIAQTCCSPFLHCSLPSTPLPSHPSPWSRSLFFQSCSLFLHWQIQTGSWSAFFTRHCLLMLLFDLLFYSSFSSPTSCALLSSPLLHFSTVWCQRQLRYFSEHTHTQTPPIFNTHIYLP